LKVDLSFKSINKLAIPALIAGIAQPIISATDLAIIGNLPNHSAEAAAAVGLVSVFLNALIWMLGQSRSAISSIISQYLGAGKLDEVKKFTRTSNIDNHSNKCPYFKHHFSLC
jgi:Na+-driven multidrug efflux pump